MKNKFKILSVLVIPVLLSNVFAQNVLTLESYLKNVNSGNPSLKAANMSIESAGNKVLEMDMVYSPFVSANYTWMDDKSGSGFGSSLDTKQMLLNSWTLGINKKWYTGSTLSFGYTNSDSDIKLNSPFSFGPYSLTNFKATDIKPFLRLEQSLLRDFMSRQTNASINKSKAQARSGQYMLLYSVQQGIFKARMTYMSLSLSREIINFRKEELARAEEILKWNENRVKLDLADKGDYLQAQALHKMRELNLQIAVEDEKSACRDFNEMLGKPGDVVGETVQPLSDLITCCENISELKFSGDRADVLSAKASFESAEFAKVETLYRSYPEITASGMMSLHGLAFSQSDAFTQITDADKPTYTLGLNLIVPLDVSTLKKVRKGYDVDYEASKENLNKAKISADKDWNKLSQTWQNVKDRLALAQDIKKIQTDRLENERTKFSRGRTTMFSLMSAENDLDDATINVFRLMLEELSIQAQVEFYNTKPF
ncbi:MAG: hypothetical protein A3J83_02680 [Elusimicrobia bacterium RIFOXYA2_FULL_40_6]|nr:MAG: hypothetical protein A3J83_02680 [Elusimicrobia bacterium RIFOXYA2_FULL_40_6]